MLPAGDKIKDYDSRVDPDAPPQQAKVRISPSPTWIFVDLKNHLTVVFVLIRVSMSGSGGKP